MTDLASPSLVQLEAVFKLHLKDVVSLMTAKGQEMSQDTCNLSSGDENGFLDGLHEIL